MNTNSVPRPNGRLFYHLRGHSKNESQMQVDGTRVIDGFGVKDCILKYSFEP